ncbi:uncharacterized protein K452DRAFT_298295 [Aplosporella prunicola CBS 121167]|uniref:Zn(2)-C6 fungal-type domain-containing protein n=1 Tax=Aplosporella prunicola CBS 121167 TaxID=1176127 RepID=A0A6A6BC30_9PEZI|nr:uncharacterized protein K452DRAFT_298295 [Aplosporella prunicola CBS 121167]KAF2141596.1 hypothetical protein K452DRAFT_298295 [Aplosporella prunicola CBS 121167]
MRTDPACGTCRKKCRRCDRARPVCNRCRVKGLHCEGYPPRFQFCLYERDPKSLRVLEEEPSLPPSSHEASSGLAPHERESSASHADIAATPYAGRLLAHFETYLCDAQIIACPGVQNPFRTYILPLAHHHLGVLHCVLALSACHLVSSGRDASPANETIALEHRLAALQALSALILEEEVVGLDAFKEEVTLVLVLLLILHDITETGISAHGTHLTGAAALCDKIAARTTPLSPFLTFLLAALSWLDLIRSFSGAEKLAFSPAVRLRVRDAHDLGLETLAGCPTAMFVRIGEVLALGKQYKLGLLDGEVFKAELAAAEAWFRAWDAERDAAAAAYPTADAAWGVLAHAFRHACLLRVLRFPDPFAVPCTDARVRASVAAILDAAAEVPWRSVLFKRLLFPLFMAGADTDSAHQMHYVRLCIEHIRRETGCQHGAMMELLERVWAERRGEGEGVALRVGGAEARNVPWMEFTCSEMLERQHAYLFY